MSEVKNWMQEVKDSWEQISDSEWYCSLRADDKIAELVNNPAAAFHPGVYRLLSRYFPDWRGKRVLLPSSGDNHAAFALAQLGAEVTSTDISERQLEHAREIAEKQGLSIRFACEDTTELSGIESGAYDLVYTSNGTHTWIADVARMYQNISRVLRPGGMSVMYDMTSILSAAPLPGSPGKPRGFGSPIRRSCPTATGGCTTW